MQYEIVLKKLHDERVRQKVSLRKVGRLLGISAQQVSAIEKGRSPLKMEYFLLICQILKTHPYTFFQDKYKEKCIALAEKIERLPQRDYWVISNLITLMSTPEDNA